jgi:hypothetical protein
VVAAAEEHNRAIDFIHLPGGSQGPQLIRQNKYDVMGVCELVVLDLLDNVH